MAPSAKLRAGVARCAKGAAHADVKAVQKFVGFGHGFDPPPPIKSFRRLAAVLFVLALAVVAVQAHGDVRASFRLGKGLEVLNLGMGFDHLDLPRGAPGWRARWAGPEYGGGAAAEAAMSAALYFAHADYLKSLREASRKGQSTLLYVALILLGFALVVWHAGATKREAAPTTDVAYALAKAQSALALSQSQLLAAEDAVYEGLVKARIQNTALSKAYESSDRLLELNASLHAHVATLGDANGTLRKALAGALTDQAAAKREVTLNEELFKQKLSEQKELRFQAQVRHADEQRTHANEVDKLQAQLATLRQNAPGRSTNLSQTQRPLSNVAGRGRSTVLSQTQRPAPLQTTGHLTMLSQGRSQRPTPLSTTSLLCLCSGRLMLFSDTPENPEYFFGQGGQGDAVEPAPPAVVAPAICGDTPARSPTAVACVALPDANVSDAKVVASAPPTAPAAPEVDAASLGYLLVDAPRGEAPRTA